MGARVEAMCFQAMWSTAFNVYSPTMAPAPMNPSRGGGVSSPLAPALGSAAAEVEVALVRCLLRFTKPL
jgi:hypothetical protein